MIAALVFTVFEKEKPHMSPILNLLVTNRRTVILLLLVAALLALVIPVFAAPLVLSTTLTGAAEVPGPGDPDGSGWATVTLNTAPKTVCFEIHVEDIAPATMAHIHAGSADVAGPIVVHLTPPDADGNSSGCATDVPSSLIRALRMRPRNYYVNVHNADYPPGALRGQLSK
jgi:hypothetical protein